MALNQFLKKIVKYSENSGVYFLVTKAKHCQVICTVFTPLSIIDIQWNDNQGYVVWECNIVSQKVLEVLDYSFKVSWTNSDDDTKFWD